MECINLLSAFDREIEVLEINDDYMIYALDQKNELKDLCSIEKMAFKDKETQCLISLDYTRLWESFRTYGQLPGFFYAINVLQDYRVRLRRVNKITWKNDLDILVIPEGEILNFYSINEEYMVITDEVKADDEICQTYGINSEGLRYMNIRYLYEIKTSKKYPIKDSHFQSKTEDIYVRAFNGIPTVIYEAFDKDEADEGSHSSSTILTVGVDEFIAHVKADGLCGFKNLALAGEDGFDYVRLMHTDDGHVIYRRRKVLEGLEQIICAEFNQDGCIKMPLCQYHIPADGEVFYDMLSGNVYHCPDDEDAPVKSVVCLNQPQTAQSYDGRYGRFAKLYGDELLVTTYFDEVFVKEYEYREYAALHDLKKGTVETVCGRVEAAADTLVLLESFLAL